MDDESEEIADNLVEILERCGVWNNQDSRKQSLWGQLKASLDCLLRNVEKIQTSNIKSEQASELFLDIEQASQDIRAHLNLALEESNDISVALALCHDLTTKCHNVPMNPIGHVALALSSSIRNQRMDVHDALNEVDDLLSRLYEDVLLGKSSQRDVMRRLQLLADHLGRRCIDPNVSPWIDSKDIVHSLLSTKSRTNQCLPLTTPLLPLQRQGLEQTISNVEANNSSQTELTGEPKNILEAALVFVNHRLISSNINRCLLLVGSEGSGKTFWLDQIQKLAPSTVNVIRPSLPYDVMGTKVGLTEDLLISMVAYAVQEPNRSILLLDDIETVCGSHYEETNSSSSTGVETSGANTVVNNEPHLTARSRSLLLCLLEIIRSSPMANVMIICTASTNWGKDVDRFDRVFILDNPSPSERENLIRNCVAKLWQDYPCEEEETKVEDSLSNLVDSTSGLQYSELAFFCREAMMQTMKAKAKPLDFLHSLKHQVQSAVPDSLKKGAVSDFVDMRVWTLRDLRAAKVLASHHSEDATSFKLPLYGKSMDYAWQELQRLVITPLCDASKLQALMNHDLKNSGSNGGGKVFAGGVLLSGVPGCGKSALAYQCAALAALKNPAVKLIDVSCTSLIHKQVGSSEQAIHRLFKIVKGAAPCILLMDGIENIAAVRGNDNTTEGTMDRVLSTLLTELDGVDGETTSAENPACMAIVGITHNPEWVDPALRRPGRLECVIQLELPELEARREIAAREITGVVIDGFGDSNAVLAAALFIAERTEGYSGAAIVGVCNEAKIRASSDIMTHGRSEDREYAISIYHITDAINSQRPGSK